MIFMGPFRLEVASDSMTCTRQYAVMSMQCPYPQGATIPWDTLWECCRTLSPAEMAVTRISCPCLPCMGRRNPTSTD